MSNTNKYLPNYRIILFLSFIVLAIFGFSKYSSAASLNEALSTAYENSPDIKSAFKELAVKSDAMPSALTGLLPEVSANIERSKKYYNSSSADANGMTDSKEIGITQPLFNGGKTYNNIKKAKNTVLLAKEEFRKTEQDLLLKAATAYMDVVSSSEVLELAKNNKKVLIQHLEATKARFELGEVTQTDVAQSKASLAAADSDLISAEREYELASASFEKITGMKPVNVAMPTSPIEVKGNADELVRIALSTNPNVKIAEYTLAAAKSDIMIAGSALLPSLNAFANKQREKNLLLSTSSNSGKTETDTVGLSLSIPLFKSGSEYINIRQAKNLASKYDFDLSSVKNATRESVVKAFQDYRIAQSLIHSNQINVDASEIALNGTKEEALVGIRTTIDVLDAEHALFEAKAKLIKSRRDEIVGSYSLLAELGKLSLSELGLK